MSEIRRIRRDNIGTILKQGDTAEVHFSLYDAENGNDSGILNQPAEVVFLQDETVVYTTNGQVDDMYMCKFHVETVLPAGLYHVEFIVNGGIYPSGDKPYFTITKSSRGADANIIQAYGFDDVVKRVVSEVTHTNLATKEDLAQVQKEHNEVTAQLAQNAKFSSPNLANINEKNSDEPIVTFIDDDGQIETYTRLLPIFRSKQVPFGGAIITGYVKEGRPSFMNLQQIQECRQYGMEALSHTVNHYNLANLSPAEVDFELRESKKWLVENQLENESHVYPQSGQNLNIRKNTRYYYDYAFGDKGFNDLGYLDHSRIKRIGFGSWTEDNPVVDGNGEKDTLAYYKACVDYAMANNLWLVFMIHVKQQPLEQDTILGELIDYIKGLNIRILKPSEAFRIKANKLSVGDLEEQYLYVGESKVATNVTSYKRERLNGRNNSSPVTEYKKGYTTIMDVTNADQASLPNSSGTLETYRTDLNWEGYSFQTFRPLANNRTYKRLWNVTTEDWDEWTWVEGESNPIRTLTYNSVNATTPDSHFEANKISYCLIQTANANGFPRNSAGLLVVDKTITVNGYRKQRYHLYTSNEIWERLINPDGTYGEWVCLNPYHRVTLNVPETLVPVNGTIDVAVDLDGLHAGSSQVWGNPAWGLSEGLMYNIMVTEHNKVTIRFVNFSDINITITARNWMFTYVS